MNVYVLVTCRNESLRDMSELVFKSIKTGFPTYNIVRVDNTTKTHAEMLVELFLKENEPFWVTDTDIVFYENMEDIMSSSAITGRYEPSFIEEWTHSIKLERVHTCLMLINPMTLREEFSKWVSKFDSSLLERFGFDFSLLHYVSGIIIPTPTSPLLYDTCAMLYHIVSCSKFSEEENQRFEHVNCGSYSDKVPSRLGKELQLINSVAITNPSKLRGLQKVQNKFYEQRQTICQEQTLT